MMHQVVIIQETLVEIMRVLLDQSKFVKHRIVDEGVLLVLLNAIGIGFCWYNFFVVFQWCFKDVIPLFRKLIS